MAGGIAPLPLGGGFQRLPVRSSVINKPSESITELPREGSGKAGLFVNLGTLRAFAEPRRAQPQCSFRLYRRQASYSWMDADDVLAAEYDTPFSAKIGAQNVPMRVCPTRRRQPAGWLVASAGLVRRGSRPLRRKGIIVNRICDKRMKKTGIIVSEIEANKLTIAVLFLYLFSIIVFPTSTYSLKLNRGQ